LSWYFVLFFRYAWAHLTKKLGTLDTLPLGQQALNQLGTPGGAKSFLRGAHIFWTVSNSFKLCPTHFSSGGEKLCLPWLRVCRSV